MDLIRPKISNFILIHYKNIMNKNTVLKPISKPFIVLIKDERKLKITKHLLLSQKKSIKSRARMIFSNRGNKPRLTLKPIIVKNF